jgi:hypothetical protein
MRLGHPTLHPSVSSSSGEWTELPPHVAAPSPGPPLPCGRQMPARAQGRRWRAFSSSGCSRGSESHPGGGNDSRWPLLVSAVLGMEAAGSDSASAFALLQPRWWPGHRRLVVAVALAGPLPQRSDPAVPGPDPRNAGPWDDGRWGHSEMACVGCGMLAQGAVARLRCP